MKKVLVEACDYCHTQEYIVLVEDDVHVPWTVECTSGFGLFGGGPCCALIGTTVLEDSRTVVEETN